MPLTIELENSAEQIAFNLKRWADVLADPDLARLPHRIETDRHGHILMRPPPAPAHGDRESEMVFQLKTLLPHGRTITNCPVSTSDGVKAPDVAWLVPERRSEVRSLICLTRAPEICVEVPSPSNTDKEIQEKTGLYFAAGASEVWICDEDGSLRFYFPAPPNLRRRSGLCPEFPAMISVA